MTDWQPIETAPQEDTIVLGKWYEDDCSGYNGESRWLWIASGNLIGNVMWCDFTDEEESPVNYHEPTHWQPLPTPPTEI